jgi:hypothetical protein
MMDNKSKKGFDDEKAPTLWYKKKLSGNFMNLVFTFDADVLMNLKDGRKDRI